MASRQGPTVMPGPHPEWHGVNRGRFIPERGRIARAACRRVLSLGFIIAVIWAVPVGARSISRP